MNFPFLKKETFGLRTQETFIGKKCEIYIPEYFIDKNNNNALATDLGDKIETIGLFVFKVDDRDTYELQLPISFQFQFTSVDKKVMRVKPGTTEKKFYVYTLKTGDAFVYDILHKQSVDDLKFFISKLIEGAKIPPYIPYSDVMGIFLNAMTATKITNLGVSAVSIEFLLSELYRSKQHLQKPFRLSYKGRSDYNYKAIRITKIPQLNSTFTGITGEDINNQLVSAVLRTREGKIDRETPIEKIIKY